MNKLFTKIAALALGMTMATGVGVAVASGTKETSPVHAAADTYVTMGSGSGSNNVNTWHIDTDKVTVTQNKGSGSTNPNASYVSGTNTRFYVGNVMAFVAASGYKVTGVKITNSTSSSYYGGTYHANTSWTSATSNITSDDTTNLTLTNCASTTSGSTSTIESKAASGVAAIYIGTTKQSRPSKIEVKYTSSTTSYTTTVNVTGGALSVNNTSTSFTSALKSGYVYLTPDGDHVIPDNPASSFSVTNATLSSAYDNQDGDVALYLTSVSGNITVSGAFDEKQGTYYSVSYTGSNGSLSNTSDVAEGDPLDVYLEPDTHYHLPTSITLTMGGVTQTAGTDYDYDNSTGEIQILEVTGNVVISTSCVEDTKYAVTYVAGDHGSGSNYVVSNQYAGSYTLVTFATAGFTASSGYTFTKWSVGGVQYAEGASITISGNTTVTAIYAEAVDYSLFSGVLVEGDYVIYDATSGVALKNELASNTNYIGYTTVSPVSNKFTNPDASLVWHIGASATSGYWTIYNSTVDKYAASTGAKNKGQLLSDGTDAKSLWSCSSTSSSTTYDFVNKQNNTSGVNDTLRYNSGYGFACYSTSTGHVLTLYKAPSNELDSVTTSGQNTSFTAGTKWSFGGTLTAHYTLETDATVTPTSFKFGDSGINPTTAGTAITTDTTLDHDTHNGKYIYVIYTEDKITKYCSYQITVNYAAVTSVEIDTHTAEIGLNEKYNYTLVGVTVNTSYADQGYEWIVHANTVGDDYSFDGSGLESKDTEGTITLWCRSTADNSKYDELVVTVTGDPTAEFTPESVSGYVGKGTFVAFTYGNMDDTSKISVSSNNASVTVGEITASDGEGSVAITFVSAGSATLSISYDGGSTLDSITVTVSTDSVTALTWSAPTIKVYSGATTTVSDASSWNVHYTMASGDYGSLLYGEYTLKLGGSAITLPHTWDASEDGEVLSIEYGGFASPTTSTVNVTQTLRAVMAPVEGEPTTSTLTFTEKYATGGATSSGGEEWVVESDGTESNFDTTKGIHYGTGSAAVQYIKLTTDDFASGTITKVVVNASTASGVSAKAGVTVGGDQFGGEPKSLSTSAANYTFEGNAAAGEIVVTITKPSSATKAIYCLSVAVTYVESSGTQNIANVSGHEAAQKAVVKFAKAFNAAMDDTENCTTGLSDAWTTATNAWTTFNNDISSLSAAEQEYAKNLIKYATAQWTEGTDSNYEYCLERAMATYERCVSVHKMTAFMRSVRPVERVANTNPISLIGSTSSNAVAIIIIVSVISVSAIGGYFFLRKKREN